MADRIFKPALAAACAALLLAVAASVAAPKPRGGGASGQITSAKIKNGTIRNVDIGTNAITGSRINEGSLKRVPDAEEIGGNQIDKINYHGTAGSGPIKILDLGGLQLNAGCAGGPDLSLDAGTTIAGSALLSATTDVSTGLPANAVHVPSMTTAGVQNLLPGADAPQVGQLRFIGSGGQVVTAEFATELGAGGGDCVVTGHAVFG
ncbi:MAG: hypothetical protein QOG62_2287 [Thermoleophilaceae bacterium]|jgi:hypothetical protein|nr:hypothetical protein [Thermoleophilaceae bacterium]